MDSNHGLTAGVLTSFVNLTQPRLIQEESLSEELSILGWPVGMSVGDYFN